jgi:hypothetical protein
VRECRFRSSAAVIAKVLPRVGESLAEDDIQFVAPMLAESDEVPFHLGREIAKHRQVRGVDTEGRRYQKKPGGQIRNLRAEEIPFPFES